MTEPKPPTLVLLGAPKTFLLFKNTEKVGSGFAKHLEPVDVIPLVGIIPLVKIMK